jgi:hypothetical protein
MIITDIAHEILLTYGKMYFADSSTDIHIDAVDMEEHANKFVTPYKKSHALAFIQLSEDSGKKYELVLFGDNIYPLHYHYASDNLDECYSLLGRLHDKDYAVLDEMVYESGLTYWPTNED